MGLRIGDNGGIQVSPETVYGTAGVAFVHQHAKTATLAPKQNLLPPGQLGASNPVTRQYGVPFADSELGYAWDESRAVVGDILAAAGNLTTNDYTIGDGSAPDNDIGLTVDVNYGGYSIQYTGYRHQVLRWEFQPDSPVMFTTGGLAQGFGAITATTPAPPAESGIIWESDVSPFSIGAVANCALTGSIEVQMPLVGSDRHCLGGATIKKPVYTGRNVLTGAFQVELSDTSGEDTEAILAKFISGTVLGDIILGNFLLTNCYMNGDGPALGEGITSFPINVTAQELVVTTTA